MSKYEGEAIYLDGEKARQIVKNSPLNYTQIGLCVGKSHAWFSTVLKRGVISSDSMRKLKTFVGIDLEPAVISAEEWNCGTADAQTTKQNPTDVQVIKQNPLDDLHRIVDDYSYVRSNDIDRLIDAIDRLTETLREVWK